MLALHASDRPNTQKGDYTVEIGLAPAQSLAFVTTQWTCGQSGQGIRGFTAQHSCSFPAGGLVLSSDLLGEKVLACHQCCFTACTRVKFWGLALHNVRARRGVTEVTVLANPSGLLQPITDSALTTNGSQINAGRCPLANCSLQEGGVHMGLGYARSATAPAVASALYSYDRKRCFNLPMQDAPAAAPSLPKSRRSKVRV